MARKKRGGTIFDERTGAMMTPAEHEAFMKAVKKREGKKKIDTEVDKNRNLVEKLVKMDLDDIDEGLKQVNPHVLEKKFLEHCLKKGWLIRTRDGESNLFFITRAGREELKRFEIEM